MGIYLPKVKMPKDCHECDALGISDVVGVECDRTTTSCPLIEVPIPHGRLIDADAIKEMAWKAESEACFYALEDVISVTDMDEAPTVIESEE